MSARRQARVVGQPRRRQRVGHPHRPEQGRQEDQGRGRAARAWPSTRRAGSPTSPTRPAAPDGDPDRQRDTRRSSTPAGHAASARAGTITTGAEPWNVVISPDGQRVFVANSGQDTITVINAATRKLDRPAWICATACATPPDTRPPLPAARHGGDAGQHQLYVTRFLSFTKAGRRAGRRQRQGGRRLPARHQHRRRASSPATSRPSAITLAPQVTGFTIDANGDGVPTRPRRSPTSCRASSFAATGPTCRTSRPRPAGRCGSTSTRRRSSTSIGGVSSGARPTRARPSSQPAPGRAQPRGRARRSCSSPTRGRSPSPTRAAPATPTPSRPAATCWSS